MSLGSLNVSPRVAVVAAMLVVGHAPALLAQEEDKIALGKQVFTEIAQPQCGICHTLADAGTSGTLGPNLDTMELSEDQVRLAVEQGVGVMPSFADTLSEEDIEAVAHYVANASGGS